MASISSSPQTVEEIFKDYSARRAGIVRALTYDVDAFYGLCDPEKENLCLYGHANETWEVNLPAEEVPPELPEPALGINFARDGMNRRDWLSLVAVHSDCWLLSVAFYLGARLNRNERKRLFSMINDMPTVFEVVGDRKPAKDKPSADSGSASILKNDEELYAPLYRNVSTFKRSYQVMERILRVYVYKDGEKPIFHQPIQKGLYASEGWFMKLMEGNKHFTVKDAQRAHLFYMPFSSRMLEHTLYVRNSHNRTNLRQYLKDYSEKIAAKYRFWNRTGGADHFLVACHDWAPYETRHHMEHCIKALCNADVTMGYKIGRDVSLPETYVRSARNPLRDLGGKVPSQRHILAFYAGSMHGYLRPILLKYWKDKDPDMKIFGPMPPGVASKMNYIQHMKSSKYCICPKGYEVNSPRVVEAIFYECVPVIISDNFVPPFFEILNWNAFSVILAEKDIPRLKEILLSIPEKEYLKMQFGVRKVQRHFLWHAKPMKYDLFHMTLHSIWYNRVFQIKLR